MRLNKGTFQITVKTAENKYASGLFIFKEWALFRGPFLFSNMPLLYSGVEKHHRERIYFPFLVTDAQAQKQDFV